MKTTLRKFTAVCIASLWAVTGSTAAYITAAEEPENIISEEAPLSDGENLPLPETGGIAAVPIIAAMTAAAVIASAKCKSKEK